MHSHRWSEQGHLGVILFISQQKKKKKKERKEKRRNKKKERPGSQKPLIVEQQKQIYTSPYGHNAIITAQNADLMEEINNLNWRQKCFLLHAYHRYQATLEFHPN